ncbi:helix-turn-helix transcriptional regulator [Thioflavicoccus mobilis]|uniref:helix-turn-helix transcriptional regulator n=1 Tax=Thioflavicoccus mobilis TaxID=80679 RepID=UPI000A012810|nr:AlpA family phage regulatory protein [Thioflavicoccus mobilis]
MGADTGGERQRKCAAFPSCTGLWRVRYCVHRSPDGYAEAQVKPTYRLVRLAEGMGRTGLGRSAFYAAISDGFLPKPVKLGRASAWPEHELDSVVAAMIRGDSPELLRDLVRRLHAERAHCGRDIAMPG